MNDRPKETWRCKTPTMIQMEAVECGAAALGIVLGYYGRYVPLVDLRQATGVSRDGSNALNMIKAAEDFGLEGKGFQKPLQGLFSIRSPMVVMWEYNHFVVVEGFGKEKVYVNDPASGPRVMSYEEFAEGYSGVVLTFSKTDAFEKGGKPPPLWREVKARLTLVKAPLVFLFLTGLLLLIPGLSLPAFTRLFVDQVLPNPYLDWRSLFLWSVVLMIFIAFGLCFLQSRYLVRLGVRLSLKLTSHFLWYVLRLPVFFFTQRYPGEIAYRVTLGTSIVEVLTSRLATTLVDLFLVVFYGVIMLLYDFWIGLIGFCAVAANFALFVWVQRSRRDAYARLQQDTGKWVGNSIGALQVIETIKATGLEGDFFSRFTGYYTRTLNAQQEIGRKDAYLGGGPNLFKGLSLAALLAIGTLRVMEGELSYGSLIALQVLLVSFLGPVGRFVNFGRSLQNIRIDLGRWNDVTQNALDPLYEARVEGEESEKLNGKLEFRNVTFGYSHADPPLLEKLSFTIEPGERLAIVGPSGCGKSTIARLAAGLYSPWEGEILYDGKPIEEIGQRCFAESIGYVDQDIVLFSGTIGDNLRLWNPLIREENVIEAAIDAQIHDQILSRPGGYENVLAEGGRSLSGGERQRLEIARALVSSPRLLFLDEATSALDSDTEKEISSRLTQRGCSALMIAHRLSTIQDCDEILVLDNGKEVERGTHSELKAKGNTYAKLIAAEE